MSLSILTDEQLNDALERALKPLLDELRYLHTEVKHLTRQRGRGMTTEEAAQVLGVSVATVKRWTDPGRGRRDRNGAVHVLPCSKLEGGQYRFNESDVEEFDALFLASTTTRRTA